MKRPNISLSQEGIKEFFFRHGEKLFFGIACALILLFFWLGFTTPKYATTSPDNMLDTAKRADRYIKDGKNWEKIENYRVADKEAAKRILDDDSRLDANKYPFRNLSGTAVRTLEKRRDPEFLSPVELQTKFFRAQVVLNTEFSSPPSIERGGIQDLKDHEVITFPNEFRYEMWVYRPLKNNITSANEFITRDVVVGTALMPHGQLKSAYENAFQFARNYDEVRDTPQYVFLEVQRKSRDTEWSSITAHVHEVVTRTANPAKDLADEKYLVDNVTLKVPPFLGLDYRQISMRNDIPPRDVFAEMNANKKEDEQPSDPSDPFGSGKSSDPNTETVVADEVVEEDPPYRLVRFFDMEPKELGQEYLYRVRVWMKDPNNPMAVDAKVDAALGSGGPALGRGGGAQAEDDPPAGGGSGGGNTGGRGKAKQKAKPLYEIDLDASIRQRIKDGPQDVPDDVLNDEEMKRVFGPDFFKVLVVSDWCESKEWVTVTKGFETFVAGPVRAPTPQRAGDGTFVEGETSADVVAMSFQEDLGITVPAVSKRTFAGSMLNFRAVANVLHPLKWTVQEVFESEDGRKNAKIGRKYTTDAMVVDLMGGERQPFSNSDESFYSAGEVLIMDRNGKFQVHRDIDDETSYRQATFLSPANQAKLAEANKRGGRGEDSDSGGGRGGGGDGGR